MEVIFIVDRLETESSGQFKTGWYHTRLYPLATKGPVKPAPPFQVFHLSVISFSAEWSWLSVLSS